MSFQKEYIPKGIHTVFTTQNIISKPTNRISVQIIKWKLQEIRFSKKKNFNFPKLLNRSSPYVEKICKYTTRFEKFSNMQVVPILLASLPQPTATTTPPRPFARPPPSAWKPPSSSTARSRSSAKRAPRYISLVEILKSQLATQLITYSDYRADF